MDCQTNREKNIKRVARLILLLVVLVLGSACNNLPSPATLFGPTNTPTPTPTFTPTIVPTATSTPTVTPTPTPTPLPTPMVLVASTNMYDEIDLYADPDTDSEVVGTLAPGIIVPMIEASDDGLWLKVGIDTIGWVPARLVTLTGSIYVQPDTTDEREGVIQSDTAVNVRSGPGTKYKVLGQIKAGQVVTTLDQNEDGSWVRIQFKDGEGWVAVSAVIMAGGSPSPTPVVTEEATREP
jgi:uncharacterized protein YgiM (DUF1202 family)